MGGAGCPRSFTGCNTFSVLCQPGFRAPWGLISHSLTLSLSHSLTLSLAAASLTAPGGFFFFLPLDFFFAPIYFVLLFCRTQNTHPHPPRLPKQTLIRNESLRRSEITWPSARITLPPLPHPTPFNVHANAFQPPHCGTCTGEPLL